MEKLTIRRAVKKDCPRLMELIRELADYEKAPEKVVVPFKEFESSGFGIAPVWWAYVAEYDGKVCGFALYYVRYSTWRGKCIHLEDIYVEPSMRGKGAGGKLLDAVVGETCRLGYPGLTWQVLDWNQPAIDFYRSRGASFEREWIDCSIYF